MRYPITIPALLVTSFAIAQQAVLITTPQRVPKASTEEVAQLADRGIDVAVVVAPGCYVARMGAQVVDLGKQARIFSAPIAQADIDAMPPEHRIGARYLNELSSGAFDAKPTDPEMDWNAHPGGDERLRPDTRHKHKAPGMLKNGDEDAPDWTCTVGYNSETMLGVVNAATFFVESDGSIDPNQWTWTQADIDNVKLQVIDAWSIWSYTASLNGRSVTAVMDWYEAGNGSAQGYEPVLHSGGQDYLWITAILTNLGYAQSGSFGKLDAFNHARRGQVGADHSFSCFVAYNPSGAPTQLTDGAIGYAYLGGPYTQILWRANGWSSSQINRVYGHEVGHIFHAFDEYSSSSSSNCTRSFNGRVNSNYQGSPCSGASGCVMINNAFSGSGATRQWNLCSHTPYHLGWLGLVQPASFVSPINDVVVTQNPVKLRFQRNSPPANVSTYLKVFERTSGNEVYCGSPASTADSLMLNLVNGQYRWSVGLGVPSDGSGYAGVVADSAMFTVNAPLNADFSRTPSVLCAGSDVVFTDLSTGAPTTWNWSFPGGTPNAWTGQDPPAIVYSVPGAYNASLTVGDGFTTDGFTLTNAVTVTGGNAVPISEAFQGGLFPPTGWTVQGGGGVGGQGGISWQTTTTGSCSQGISAWVDAYGFTGTFGYTVLRTPYLDLLSTVDPYVKFKHSYARESATETEFFNAVAHDCEYGYYQQLTTEDFQLWTNDGSFVAGQPWVPTSCGHWRTNLFALPAATGHLAQFEFSMQTQGGQNFYLDDVQVFGGSRLNLRVLLEGPYDAQTQLMRDDLRAAGLVPLAEPFTAMGYVFKGEGGGEVIDTTVVQVTGNNAIVDWVLVEVRDPFTSTQIITARAALVQRDGDIVDLDGTSLLRVGVTAGSYHIAVRHRNHLGCMTANAIAVASGMSLLDFSIASTLTYGTDARKATAGKQLLWMGDVVWDHTLKYIGTSNDRDPILVRIGGVLPTATVLGYYTEDATLDGVVKYVGTANDRDPILVNIGGIIPTNTRVEQVP